MMTVIELVRQTHLYVNAQMKETVEHFLLRCPRYNQFRSKLISTIQEIGTSSKSKSHLYNIYISLNLLIAPRWDMKLSKKEDKAIKEALFHYLASVKRNLYAEKERK